MLSNDGHLQVLLLVDMKWLEITYCVQITKWHYIKRYFCDQEIDCRCYTCTKNYVSYSTVFLESLAGSVIQATRMVELVLILTHRKVEMSIPGWTSWAGSWYLDWLYFIL